MSALKPSEFEIVKGSILRIDLYGLIAGGSPYDEFDPEIKGIVKQLARCKTGRDIAHVIARVFSSSFGEKFPPERFEAEANIIVKKLGWH